MHLRVIYQLAYGGQFDVLSPYFLIGIVGLLLWAVTYILVVVHGFRAKTYGIPFAAICMNITWEFLGAFVWPRGPDDIGILVFLDTVGFLLDLCIAWQLLRYGRAEQTTEGFRRWYYAVFVFGIVFALVGQYAFVATFRDQLGMVDANLINLVMSTLFIFRFWANGRCDTATYLIAWTKGLGTACTSIMCYFWLPIIDPSPILSSQLFPVFLYVAIFITDFIYIGFLWSARWEQAHAAQPSTTAVAVGVEAHVSNSAR
jgi:hypothetical protein